MSADSWPLKKIVMTLASTTSDEDLLRLVMAGDEDAFTDLYRRRQSGVYRFALQMSGSKTVAEDVTQEVFITLMREGARYDPQRGAVAAYLYGIARNHVLRRLERERMFIQMADASEDVDALAPISVIADADPLADLTRNEMVETVRAAVLALPAHYREVVVLCDLHEISYQEAASVIGCAVGTVRSRLHRARALLVEKLRATGDDKASGVVNQARCFA
ncbi:MAG TPA: RNA polymerase sigma factor [Blastocatellia bacterium]|nr:RNA polymerase sigma factor [Blastocatellia bacterium]